MWIQKHSKAQVNWTTITHCLQKPDEDLDKFSERFVECYLLHSGQTEYDLDTFDQSLYLQQVLPKIRKGVKARLPHWDASTTTLADIMETGQKVERDEEI